MINGALTKALTDVQQNSAQLTKLKKACDGMESSFLRQMLTEMHKIVDAQKLGDDTGADTYQSMTDGALADQLASKGTLGISKTVFHAMAGRVLNSKLADK